MSDTSNERLAQSARLAWDEAPRLCRPDLGCCNYHRCWSMVRLLGSGGALPGSSEFFIERISALARTGARRVLISGAADTGLMAIVQLAARRAGVALQVVVTDRCETPLLQNRLFAREQGIEAEFHHGDILDLHCDPVDVVIAHSFLLFFPEPVRQRVIDTWARVCKPCATALVYTPIVASEDTPMLKFEAEDLDARAAKLCDAAVATGLWHDTERSALAASLKKFWSDWRSYDIRPSTTARNLREGFEKAGFDVLQVEAPQRQSSATGSGPVGTGATLSATRAEVVAVRR